LSVYMQSAREGVSVYMQSARAGLSVYMQSARAGISCLYAVRCSKVILLICSPLEQNCLFMCNTPG